MLATSAHSWSTQCSIFPYANAPPSLSVNPTQSANRLPLGLLNTNSPYSPLFYRLAGDSSNNPPQKNTPEVFVWTGSLPFIFTGTHSFYWTPSKTTPGGTTFTQEEKFTGVLGALLYGESVVARSAGRKESTRKGWQGLNEDLKKVVESEQGGK